jgi:hypothetical protein
LDWETGEQVHLSAREAVLKALGFLPEKMARGYDRDRLFRAVEGEKAVTKQQWVDRALLAGKSGDEQAIGEISREIAAYNESMRQRNRASLMISEAEVTQAALNLSDLANPPTGSRLGIYLEMYREREEKNKQED